MTARIDLIGALGHVTPELVVRAAGLVRQGRIYSLAQVLEPSMPHLFDAPGSRPGNRLQLQTRSIERPDGRSRVFADAVSFDTHSGTHIDAFGHWSVNGQLFGGLDADEVYDERGLRQLGMDQAAPLFTRGVLIDAAKHRGVDVLPVGTVLQEPDLRACLSQQGATLAPGDAVLVRTGWSRHWGTPETYMGASPGVSRSAAAWLADQGCVVVGADQWLVDASPPERPEDSRACHEVLLVERGVHIIENLNLEALAADRVYEFLLVALAAPLRGATAFPAQVLAVV
jgi:kynurenine formamidase